MVNIEPLEDWVKKGTELSRSKGYDPSEFIAMCGRHGTVEAMERLMRSSQIQSGLVRLKELGMADEWSVEAGVLRFAKLFREESCKAAAFRLAHIDDKSLR